MSSIVPPGSLAYGIQLPVQAQSRLFAEPWEAAAGPAEIAAVARAADAAGFLYVGVCDHVAIPRELAGGMGTVWYDTVATLAWLAAQTSRVRLLSHVWNATYRHPLVGAKAFATLDVLSGGRVVVGVGAGHATGEFAALGVPFGRRGELTDAALDVLDAALTEEYVGDVAVAPRPVQRPRPPIWVGGSSEAAVRRAARRGDGWLPQSVGLDGLVSLLAIVRAERDPARDPLDAGAITDWIYLGVPSWEVGRRCVTGSADAVAAALLPYRDAGVDHLQVRFPSRSVTELVDQVTAFGAQVAPLLAR